MKLTLLSAMLMTAVVGITSANAADYKKLLLPPMQLIRGLAVGCHVTWINLRIVLKISTVWLISSASILVLIAPVLVCWGFAGEEGILLLPPRRTNDSNRLQPLACLIQDLYGAMVCRIHSWILFNNVFSRLQMHELRKSPVAKCFTPVMPT